jgi:hypothetical protein
MRLLAMPSETRASSCSRQRPGAQSRQVPLKGVARRPRSRVGADAGGGAGTRGALGLDAGGHPLAHSTHSPEVGQRAASAGNQVAATWPSLRDGDQFGQVAVEHLAELPGLLRLCPLAPPGFLDLGNQIVDGGQEFIRSLRISWGPVVFGR